VVPCNTGTSLLCYLELGERFEPLRFGSCGANLDSSKYWLLLLFKHPEKYVYDKKGPI